MSNIIEDFYYGNIEPQEVNTELTPKLKKKLSNLTEKEEQLTARLTGEDEELFQNYMIKYYYIVKNRNSATPYKSRNCGLVFLNMFCKIHIFTINYYLLPAPKIESISEEWIVNSEKVKIDILLSKNVDFWCETGLEGLENS